MTSPGVGLAATRFPSLPRLRQPLVDGEQALRQATAVALQVHPLPLPPQRKTSRPWRLLWPLASRSVCARAYLQTERLLEPGRAAAMVTHLDFLRRIEAIPSSARWAHTARPEHRLCVVKML